MIIEISIIEMIKLQQKAGGSGMANTTLCYRLTLTEASLTYNLLYSQSK
jgi:hypothetical protein